MSLKLLLGIYYHLNFNRLYDNTAYGIHIHCPEAATPKDGPSAGGAITIAILSQILGVRVNNECAMTGEIDLNGSIHQIGGLESKLYGAKVAGVKRVLIPESNRNDYEKILKSKDTRISENDPDFQIILVKHIHEVIPHFLLFNEGQMEECINMNNHMCCVIKKYYIFLSMYKIIQFIKI